MKNQQIRHWLCVVVLLVVGALGKVSAQTFYELDYTDKQGYKNHGLMLYYDEENCTLYLRRHTSDGENFSFRTLPYISARNNEGGEDYQVMVCEDDDTPILIWLWDEEKSEEQQLVPYVALSENDDTEDWIRATSFYEVNLRQLTHEYLEQYLETDSELYRQIVLARREAIESDKEAADKESSTIASLGDGSGIIQAIYSDVMAGRAEEEKVTASTGNNGGSTIGTVTGGATCSVTDRPVMHLFIVANTEVADIGAACRTDYNNITNEMRGITQSIGIRMKEYDVTGSNYSKDGLLHQLASLQPAANDIVLFLYTGHGFRFDDQKDAYPMMALTTNDYQPLDNNYVALSDVYDAICKKGARLSIVLSDCCNSNIGERRPLQSNTLFTRGNNSFSNKRLTELFFNAKGSILSTAASPGEYSWCDTAGGMFTLSFIQSLRKEISAMNTTAVNWQSVVDNTLRSALQRSSNTAKAQNGLKSMKVVKM